jgi:choline transport protein
MKDVIDSKVFDKTVTEDVALEQLGYQQGLCHGQMCNQI